MGAKSNPYSNLKIFSHCDKLKAIKEGQHVAPLYVRVKPTNRCNHNCNYCHYASGQYLNLEEMRQQDEIAREKMLEVIDDFAEIGVKAVTFSGGGEPLNYPHIVETMRKVQEYGIDLSIITNGSLLFGERAEILKDAKWVRISLDSGTKETYSKIRSIPLDSFDKVCENIRDFAKIKNKNCELGVNFVVTEENAYEVYKAGKLLKNIGVNHIKLSARMTNNIESYHKAFKGDVIKQIADLERECVSDEFRIINKYESDFEVDGVFSREYPKCYVKEVLCVVAADSKIYFCQDKAYLTDGIVGDIKEKSFKEVWFSDEVKALFENFDPQKSCQHHCVHDDRNTLLNTFFGLDDNHINFI